jgi:membrane protein YqaA with SNARE-associated domain
MIKAGTEKLYKWATLKANSANSSLWIGFIFLLEILLFIPIDTFLVFFCLQNPRKTFLYVIIAAFASTLSGVGGYLIGHFLWDIIGPFVIPHLISAATFNTISGHFHVYEHWAVFFGALAPFPLKALSLSAGVFDLGVLQFATYMLMARLLRFSLTGIAMVLWGDKVKVFLDRHFHRVMLVIGGKMALIFFLLWLASR